MGIFDIILNLLINYLQIIVLIIEQKNIFLKNKKNKKKLSNKWKKKRMKGGIDYCKVKLIKFNMKLIILK